MSAWRRYLKNRPAMAGLGVAMLLAFIAVLGPALYGADPFEMLGESYLPPGVDASFPFGTDALGRDVLAGLIAGARISLMVGLAAMVCALGVGVVVGAMAGYFRGVVDEILMRLSEFVQTIPLFLLVLALVSILGPSIESIVTSVCLASWPSVARLARAEFLSLREREFVQSCVVAGMSDLRIIFTQILPNSLSPVLVYASIIFANAVLIEAALAFLGMGDPNAMSWGLMIGNGRESLRTAWYLSAIPGCAILLTVLAINLVGEGINDALNARTSLGQPSKRQRQASRRMAQSPSGDQQDRGTLLEVHDLCVSLQHNNTTALVLDHVNLSVRRGETLALVGESGCGKSLTAQALLRILPESVARISKGAIWFAGQDLAQASEPQMHRIRGARIGMVFQEPMSALNPVLTIGEQIVEGILAHRVLGSAQALGEAQRLLASVQVADPGRILREYPHRLSGGMRQRVGMAMALACQPELLIADEPTTALDVTVQAQILRLLGQARTHSGMGLLLITHNLGVVAELADRVAVMYAGRIVEEGSVSDVLLSPAHPYTRGLLHATPRFVREADVGSEALCEIVGIVPPPQARGANCTFAPRCPHARESCRNAIPELRPVVGQRTHQSACFATEAFL